MCFQARQANQSIRRATNHPNVAKAAGDHPDKISSTLLSSKPIEAAKLPKTQGKKLNTNSAGALAKT